MKILLLNTDDFLGGAAIACRRLLSALLLHSDLDAKMLVQEKKSGIEGVIVVDSSWLGKRYRFIRFVFEKIRFIIYEKNKAVRFGFNISKIGLNLAKNKNLQDADIIHLHWINNGFLSIHGIGKILALNKPVVWTLHDMWAFTGGCHHSGDCENFQNECGNCFEFLKKPSSTDLSNRVWEEKKIAFESKNLTIVTCSDWLRERALKSSLFKSLRVVSIPNPIDTEVFKPLKSHLALSNFGLFANKKYILFAAMRVNAVKKGFQYFKEAINILFEKVGEDSNIEILIFGEASQSDFNDFGFKVNVLGKLSSPDTMAKAYSAASVFVIPSLEENLPNTIVESMACATPVVGFDIGGIPELISHKRTGYLAEYKSSADLASGIYWTLFESNFELLQKNCRSKVLENLDQKVIAKKYLELYKSLV